MAEAAGAEATLEKWKNIATILSLVAVPIIVALFGAWIQDSVKNSEARTKSMEIAIQILKEPPGRGDQPGLRRWAIDMLQASSSIQLSAEALKELESKPIIPVQEMQRRLRRGGVFWLQKEMTAPRQ